MLTPAANRAYRARLSLSTKEHAVVRESHASGSVTRFCIVDHLTEHAARMLRQRVLDELLDGQRTIIMDLAQAQSFDSGALGILVSITRRVQEAQGVIEFENVSDSVRLLFEMTRVDQLFAIRQRRRTP